MPEKSKYNLDIPNTDILTWLFPSSSTPSAKPIWIDAESPAKCLSPAQILLWAKRLGLGLQRLGLKENDVVLIVSENHLFVPAVYMGVTGHGFIFSGCNPAYGVNETKYQIKNTEAKLLLVDPNLLDTALNAARLTNFPSDRIFLFDDVELRPKAGVRDWRSFLASEQDAKSQKQTWRSMNSEEATTRTAVLNYSSGTTGLPKGVMITHQNVISNVLQSLYMRRLRTDDPRSLEESAMEPGTDEERWLGFLPLYHAYGQLWTISAAAYSLTPVYMLRRFQYTALLQTVQTHRITHIQTAPPLLVMLAKRPETPRYDLSSLQNIVCGAAPLSAELQNEVMERIGAPRKGSQGEKNLRVRVVQTWGMTELTCSALHVPGLMDDFSGSVGLPDPGCEFKLIDDEGHEVTKDDTRGEIHVRGPNVCRGYWRNEEATKATFDAQGFLRTGDVAIRRDGWYWIVDRKKELIKVKGFQVAPAELEALLLEHEAVADSAVVALPPARGHDGEERPRAYVTIRQDYRHRLWEEDVVRWVQGKVARHKWLTGGVGFVDEVPKSASGKIQRVVLKKWADRDARVVVGPVLKL